MPYTISGTTINVRGTVDLVDANLPPIYRINFGAGGANATFDVWDFFYVPPSGTSFTAAGSASPDVLTISIPEQGPLSSIDNMTSFSFVNWSANDVVVLKGNSGDNFIGGSYAKDVFRGGNGDDTYLIGPGDMVDERGANGIDTR